MVKTGGRYRTKSTKLSGVMICSWNLLTCGTTCYCDHQMVFFHLSTWHQRQFPVFILSETISLISVRRHTEWAACVLCRPCCHFQYASRGRNCNWWHDTLDLLGVDFFSKNGFNLNKLKQNTETTFHIWVILLKGCMTFLKIYKFDKWFWVFKVDLLCFLEQVRIGLWALQNMFIILFA